MEKAPDEMNEHVNDASLEDESNKIDASSSHNDLEAMNLSATTDDFEACTSDDDTSPTEDNQGFLARARSRIQGALSLVWAHKRLSFVAVTCVAASWGVLLGWWMPRGPAHNWPGNGFDLYRNCHGIRYWFSPE